MTHPQKSSKEVLDDYLKVNSYGSILPEQPLRPPVKRTGDIVRDYIAAAGFGLKKPE